MAHLAFPTYLSLQIEDLGSQFLLRESDVGLNRAAASLRKLQELNFYVSVDANEEPLTAATLANLKSYNVVMLTDATLALALEVNDYCRAHGILFIWTGIAGVFGHIFVDFGPTFEVLDKDGLYKS